MKTASLYRKLEALGRIRLSEHFYMRQFLYSEIAIASGIVNMPDNQSLAIEVGTRLCEDVLEPITAKFGPIIIRSGFRSAELNAYGNQHGMNCATNEKNYARHIWDQLDADDNKGASACIVVPSFNDGRASIKTLEEMKAYLYNNLPCNGIKFFAKDNSFNIGWREMPTCEAV